MSQSIRSQLKALRKLVKIPWEIKQVDHFISRKDYEEKTIYVHFWLKNDDEENKK